MVIRTWFSPLTKKFNEIIRKNTKLRLVDEAEEKKFLFSAIYFISGSFLLLFMAYHFNKIINSNLDKENVPIEEKFSKIYHSHSGDIRVVRFRNFTKVEDYFVNKDESKEKK